MTPEEFQRQFDDSWEAMERHSRWCRAVLALVREQAEIENPPRITVGDTPTAPLT